MIKIFHRYLVSILVFEFFVNSFVVKLIRRQQMSISSGLEIDNNGIVSPREDFLCELEKSIGSLSKLLLTDNKKIGDAESGLKDLKSVHGRLVNIKQGVHLQLTLRFATKDIVKNVSLKESVGTIDTYLRDGFTRALFSTDFVEFELTLKRGNGKLKKKSGLRYSDQNSKTPFIDSKYSIGESSDHQIINNAGSFSASLFNTPILNKNLNHDRKKNVPIDPSSKYLFELGVTTEGGKPKTGMTSKLRQIQKFTEVVDNLIKRSHIPDIYNSKLVDGDGSRPLRIIDMGCGLGYLTFSIHSHLRKAFPVETTGVELRQDLVDRTNSIARSLGPEFDDLKFVCGDISSMIRNPRTANCTVFSGLSPAGHASGECNVVIALHACDTATDDAIWFGIQNKAEIIITAPCCHKEVRQQVDSFLKTKSGKTNPLSPSSPILTLLQHGIFCERQSEMITDTARGLLLEIVGYETTVFEFVNFEHTAKNIMIAAVKRRRRDTNTVDRNRKLLDELLSLYGIKKQRLLSYVSNDSG